MSCRRPGFITCSICNATKYYSHVQRRFGQYSCEPCSKFMKRFLRDPKIFTCSQKGHCTIGKPSGEQEPRGVSVNRCKACWLKICLEKFILDSETRLAIDKYYAPKFSDSSGLPVDEGQSIGGDSESKGGPKHHLSNGLGSGSGGGGGEEGGELVETRETNRLPGRLDIGDCGEGEGRTGKSSAQSGLSDRIETNSCDTTISPPPLPFPQRKRKPKNETSTNSLFTSASLSSSSPSSSSSTSTSSTQVTTTTMTPQGNLINNNTGPSVTGETIPLSTSLSGNYNNRLKEKHLPHYSSSHHPLLHSAQQSQQYHSSAPFFGHLSSAASGSHTSGSGHLIAEPLCLTTSGRRSDLSSSGLLGNLSSNSRSSPFLTGSGHLSLSSAALGPRYPWSHRRKDDYDLINPSTTSGSSLTTSINFRRDLTRSFNHNDNLILRRGSDDDLNDLYSGDYSLISPELLLSGPYVGVSHVIKDSNGDGDDNVTVMGSPATPPPPPARCGKCTYCLPTIDEKANVVVVKENVGPVRCRLAEMMSKMSQSNEKGGNDDEGGVTSIVSTPPPPPPPTSTSATTTSSSSSSSSSSTLRSPSSSIATSTTTLSTDGNQVITGRGLKRSNIKRSLSSTSKGDEDDTDEGQNAEEVVHSSTPTLNNIDNNNKSGGRRSRKERRGQSRVSLDKEESDLATNATTSGADGDDNMMNDEENDDREAKSSSRETFYRKRLVSGEDEDVQSVPIKYLNHDENHLGQRNNYINSHHLNHHQVNRSSSTASSSPSSTITTNNNKLTKSGLFNGKPYKKILINEHFVNSSTLINQSTANSVNSNNPLSSRDLSGPIISPDSNFLSEILNANSPFL